MNEDLCGGRTPVQPDKEPMSLTSLMHQAVYGWLSRTAFTLIDLHEPWCGE